ncbi:MAG: hypothetical protein EOO50_13480 [Flavobacterium sp.]|uniref:hypothetical protein n=1 Tax=Flavobacterium sp. TaxID=239 RepID=UPI00120818ED|nr:hypothetical protein [Flavobacterium sp.]RZJ65552.1 MAG: hypothetical protein EOO50_13480 [Flavobacterium sp.]
MKKYLLVIALLVGSKGFCKEIPAPSVLFSITEKIFAQAQQFVFPASEKTPLKSPKIKPVIKVKSKVPLKVIDPAMEKPAAPQTTTVKVKRDGMWITTEQ